MLTAYYFGILAAELPYKPGRPNAQVWGNFYSLPTATQDQMLYGYWDWDSNLYD